MFSQNSAEINNNETGDMLSQDPLRWSAWEAAGAMPEMFCDENFQQIHGAKSENSF